MFLVHLRRMYILQFLNAMIFLYLLCSFDLMCYLRPVFPYWFFCLDNLPIKVSRVLKSPIIIVLLLISPFIFDHLFFTLTLSYVECTFLCPFILFDLLFLFLWIKQKSHLSCSWRIGLIWKPSLYRLLVTGDFDGAAEAGRAVVGVSILGVLCLRPLWQKAGTGVWMVQGESGRDSGVLTGTSNPGEGSLLIWQKL